MDNERASWVMPQHLKDFKVKVRLGKRRGREGGRESCVFVVDGLGCAMLTYAVLYMSRQIE